MSRPSARRRAAVSGHRRSRSSTHCRGGSLLPLIVPLSALAPALAADGEVVLTRDRLVTLLPVAPEPAEPDPAPLVVERRTTLRPRVADDESALDVSARWRVVVPRPAPVELVLAGPQVRVERVEVDGVPMPVQLDATGATVLRVLLRGPAVITIAGVVAADPRAGIELALLPAGVGAVDIPAGWTAEGALPVDLTGARIGAPAMIRVGPAPVAADRGTLVLGEVAVGLTVGDTEVRVRSRLRWRLTRGALERVSATIPGAGADLTVESPQIASWTRDGDRIDVVLREPERALVALELRYSLPAASGQVTVPAPVQDGVFRTTAALQIARDGQLDIFPQVDAEPRAPMALPDWARDLVDGTPTGAFVGQRAAGTVQVLRVEPAEAPPTLIDVASYTAAATAEGRVLLRAHYAVRNDRGAALTLTPPPGYQPLGVRVAGQTVAPARAPNGGWRIPLRKSVETVEGLLAFPVEVVLLGQEPAWDRRSRRELVLPAVDAEIAVSRLTLHLPPDHTGRVRAGRGDAVDVFTEGDGITYGFAVGDVRAAQADALFQGAVDAWMGNRFDQVDALLDELDEIGAANGEIGKLRANLEVLDKKSAEAEAGEDKDEENERVALERRVLDQAKARSGEDRRQLAEEVQRADQAYAEGDYDRASSSYRRALDLGESLAKLDAAEEQSQVQQNSVITEKLTQSVTVSAQKAKNKQEQVATVPDGSHEIVVTEPRAAADDDTGVDEVTTTTGAVVTRDFVQNIPVGRTFESVVQAAPGVSGKPGRGGKAGRESMSGASWVDNETVDGPTGAEPVVVSDSNGRRTTVYDFEDVTIDGQLAKPQAQLLVDRPPPLQVSAAALSVVVPGIGEVVRYQRMLLPSEAAWAVPVASRARSKSNSSGSSP